MNLIKLNESQNKSHEPRKGIGRDKGGLVGKGGYWGVGNWIASHTHMKLSNDEVN